MSDADPLAKLEEARALIARAAEEAGRAPSEIEIQAVTKTHSAETIRPLLDAGHRSFGENRVQEAQAKWPALREAYPDASLSLIGPLQSNKAADAVALFDRIETVDREKIARALAEEMDRQGRPLPVLVQVNIGEEAQKSGVLPKDAVAFARRCRDAFGLHVRGLLCIPPLGEPPAPYFALLDKLADEAGLPERSMGMSSDYEAAVSLGATRVRLGSALFGARGA